MRIILFLIINFAALAIGGLFTGKGVSSEWYQNLQKAPWTPPGWVFGAAWTTIMICFSVYMGLLWKGAKNTELLIGLFALQWILNISWNPIFFYYHQSLLGLVVIAALAILVCFFFVYYLHVLKFNSLWILPYLIWIFIATSLNGFIYFKNP